MLQLEGGGMGEGLASQTCLLSLYIYMFLQHFNNVFKIKR
jgi:hypothetical protein